MSDCSPEARCVLCGQPCVDHVRFRYWWAVWWRHRVIPIAGFIFGHLPPGREVDW